MAIPKTRQITVTTAQDVLDSNRGNKSATAIELGVFRSTLKKIIDNDRAHVVLVNDDSTYTLLK